MAPFGLSVDGDNIAEARVAAGPGDRAGRRTREAVTFMPLSRRNLLKLLPAVPLSGISALSAAAQILRPSRPRPEGALQDPAPGRVFVVIWFDTEDYILPQSDDAAKRLAVFLTNQNVRATFKVVGEKARVLDQRRRSDVIAALAQHEIGYHSNTHSQHPTPAVYCSALDWDQGVEEFHRRERSGYDDVRRIFAQTPSCYGQPGSSWTPQSYAALRRWGVRVYLDEGRHVGLEGKPFWYGGLLNIFNTREGSQLKPDEGWTNLAEAKARYQEFYLRFTSRRDGGLISLYFHPCEFIHREFWDGLNFSRGANPPPEAWKVPAMVSSEESERAFNFFEELVRHMKSFPKTTFITASQALALYRDRAQRRAYSAEEIGDVARQVDPEVSFQDHGEFALSASEAFYLLVRYVGGVLRRDPPQPILMDGTPYGPAGPAEPNWGSQPIDLTVPWWQFARATLDVLEFVEKKGQIPNVVWLGSRAASPESYLVALAQVTTRLLIKAEPPETVSFPAARLAAAEHVADDSPDLWNWVIHPEGFRAPRMMQLAKLQSWTLKPAKFSRSG